MSKLRPLCGGKAYPRWRHTAGDSRQQKVSFSQKEQKGKKSPPPSRYYSIMLSCPHSQHIVQISKPPEGSQATFAAVTAV